jgi:hypothetical protein
MTFQMTFQMNPTPAPPRCNPYDTSIVFIMRYSYRVPPMNPPKTLPDVEGYLLID